MASPYPDTPLGRMKLLLRTFLDGHFEPDEFVDLFFTQARVLRELSWHLVKANPSFEQILKAFTERKISSVQFENERAKFVTSFGDAEFIPFSKKEEALDHLWVEVDAYRSDPAERELGLHIGEDELRQVVEETLAILEG
jgi:hypothetical protein